MVTAPLLTAGVPVQLPESRAKPLEQDLKPIQISIDNNGQVFVDNAPVGQDVLPDLLADRARQGNGKPPQVFLRADTALAYGKVMWVMGELNRAGLNRVSLVTVSAGAK
jgi:biopolymer transport protein TolR